MDPHSSESPQGPKGLLLGHLKTLGVSFTDHPTPKFLNMEDCRRERGAEIPGVFCKNLLVRDKKKQFFLVCAVEDTEVDLNKLRKELGAARCLTFATPEEMAEKLQVIPGGVSPLAAWNFKDAPDVKVILDQRIMEAELANFHPLDLESTLTLSPQDLLRFLASVGVEPVVHNFSPDKSPSPSTTASTTATPSPSSLSSPSSPSLSLAPLCDTLQVE